MNDRLDENNMLYFPTSEAWTQVREPLKMVYVIPPPPMRTRRPQVEWWPDAIHATLAVL